MYKYVAKTPALAKNFRLAGRTLATWGYLVKIKGNILETTAEPRAVSMAINHIS